MCARNECMERVPVYRGDVPYLVSFVLVRRNEDALGCSPVGYDV